MNELFEGLREILDINDICNRPNSVCLLLLKNLDDFEERYGNGYPIGSHRERRPVISCVKNNNLAQIYFLSSSNFYGVNTVQISFGDCVKGECTRTFPFGDKSYLFNWKGTKQLFSLSIPAEELENLEFFQLCGPCDFAFLCEENDV